MTTMMENLNLVFQRANTKDDYEEDQIPDEAAITIRDEGRWDERLTLDEIVALCEADGLRLAGILYQMLPTSTVRSVRAHLDKLYSGRG